MRPGVVSAHVGRALPVRPTGRECRLRSVRWHVMNGNKVGNYGDFHMLSSIVKYDRTHPVQLTASNLALPLKTTREKKRQVRRHGLQRPRQLMETRELVKIGQAGTSRAPRQREKKLWVRMVEDPTIFRGDELDSVLLRYFIPHIRCCKSEVLSYTSVDASRSGGKAARILPACCVTFQLDGQGGSGEGWTGGGSEIPGGRREGPQHNATQRNRSRQSTAQTACTYMWKPRDPIPNQKYRLARSIVPRQSAVPPANCYLAVPRFGSSFPALLCSCSCSLGTSYLPCQWDVGLFPPSLPSPVSFLSVSIKTARVTTTS